MELKCMQESAHVFVSKRLNIVIKKLLNACRDMSEPSAALQCDVCVGVFYRASRRTCVDYSFENSVFIFFFLKHQYMHRAILAPGCIDMREKGLFYLLFSHMHLVFVESGPTDDLFFLFFFLSPLLLVPVFVIHVLCVYAAPIVCT